MNVLLILSTYLLDMFIITIFLNNLFTRREPYNKKKYLIALIAVEIIIYINEYLIKTYRTPYSKALTIALSLITTIILCFFFISSLKEKILAAFVFQVLASIGEILFTYIVSMVNPSFMSIDNTNILYSTMNGGSKLILLIFCIAISYFWKKESDTPPMEYHVLLLSTPIITLFVYCILPLKIIYKGDTLFYNLLFISLAILNIINFILIKKRQVYTMMKFKNAQMEQQLFFQKEKYNQLSESYRQNRRLIHDVKKHYFSIQEYIHHNDLQKLLAYTHSAIDDLEATYAKYNTGNLVIDSFLTNYANIFQSNHITFVAHLNVVSNRIPISDYDLCIILGNILDNALQACSNPNAQNSEFMIHLNP